MLRIIILLLLNIFISICYSANTSDSNIELVKDFDTYSKRYSQAYEDEINKITMSTTELMRNVDINKDEFLKLQKDLIKKAYAEQGKPKLDSQVLVFVSFSMPKRAIKQLLIESRKHNSSLIIQGLVNNSFKETLYKISQLVAGDKNANGIHIDPNLFNEYKINRVPAYVIRYGNDNKEHDVVYGLGSIHEALEIFTNGNTGSSIIAKGIMSNG